MEFAVGDKVKLIEGNPRFGLGCIKVGDVGVVTRIATPHEGVQSFYVKFEDHSGWHGLATEFELVEQPVEVPDGVKKALKPMTAKAALAMYKRAQTAISVAELHKKHAITELAKHGVKPL